MFRPASNRVTGTAALQIFQSRTKNAFIATGARVHCHLNIQTLRPSLPALQRVYCLLFACQPSVIPLFHLAMLFPYHEKKTTSSGSNCGPPKRLGLRHAIRADIDMQDGNRPLERAGKRCGAMRKTYAFCRSPRVVPPLLAASLTDQ